MINPASASLLIPYLKDVWTMSWIVSGLVTIFVPVIIWQSQRGAYFSTYGAYQKAQDYYEQKQRYYEQQNNGNNGNNGNNQNSYYRECSWINWPCRRRQWKLATYNNGDNGDNGGGDRVRQPVPAWYVFLGGETEAMQRWREENTGEDRGGAGGANASRSNAGMNFAYFITLVLFLSLLIFGAKTVAKKEPLTQLTLVLVVAAMVAVMNLIMSVSAIPSDDRDLEESYYGWYGQTSVLMVYTNFWITLFSFAFLVIFQTKNFISRNKYAKEELNDDDDTEEKGGDYHAPSEVQMA